MKKILTVILLLTLTICAGCDNSFSNANKIIAGLDDNFPPMSFRDAKGIIGGFDVDLAKETAKRLGMKIEFKSIDWSLKLDELNSKHIDIIWSGLDITPERQENILFSKPYMDNRQIVFVRRDGDFKIISEIDLAGKIVGTQAGSTVSDYLDTNENLKNSFRELKTYNTYTNAWNALDYGEIDALICDEIFGRYAMSKELDKFEALNVIVGTASSFGVGFRKTDVELRNKVQKVLNEMIKDGTAKKISERWFQADLIKSHR